MSIEAASVNVSLNLSTHETEAAMLRTLGSILRHGTFGIEEVETLASGASDSNIDAAARCFAGQSLRWLAQQSAMMTTPIRQPDSDARN